MYKIKRREPFGGVQLPLKTAKDGVVVVKLAPSSVPFTVPLIAGKLQKHFGK